MKRRLSGDKVINQDSKAPVLKQRSAYQSIGPSRVRKERGSAEPRFPPARILYIKWHKKSAYVFTMQKPRVITIRGFYLNKKGRT